MISSKKEETTKIEVVRVEIDPTIKENIARTIKLNLNKVQKKLQRRQVSILVEESPLLRSKFLRMYLSQWKLLNKLLSHQFKKLLSQSLSNQKKPLNFHNQRKRIDQPK